MERSWFNTKLLILAIQFINAENLQSVQLMCYFNSVVFNLAKYILTRKGHLTVICIPLVADKLIHVVEFAQPLCTLVV